MVYVPKLNKAKLARSLDFTKSREYVIKTKEVVRSEFNKIKKKLIESFNTHPVTLEIDGGLHASNLSGTLGGRGNLFRFIGFDKGSKPIDPIRGALRGIDLTSTIVKKDGTSLSHVVYPTANDIFNMTPLPWASNRSWARGIERGISNLGQFLNIESEYSRAGIGLQVEDSSTGLSFNPTPYISEIIEKFENDIARLNRSTI